jgi:hypothetical protein
MYAAYFKLMAPTLSDGWARADNTLSQSKLGAM